MYCVICYNTLKTERRSHMAELLEMLAAFAYQYGIAGANMASMRGNHEGSVPEELIDSAED